MTYNASSAAVRDAGLIQSQMRHTYPGRQAAMQTSPGTAFSHASGNLPLATFGGDELWKGVNAGKNALKQ